MNTTYNNAFAETLFIIRCLPYNEQSKISKKFIEFLDENKNDDFVITINPNISLQRQQLLEETKELLKEIYMSYFISEEKRKTILQYDRYRNIVEEDLKNQKYDYNNLFKNKTTDILPEENTRNTVAIIEYKESILKKLLNKIKGIFKK